MNEIKLCDKCGKEEAKIIFTNEENIEVNFCNDCFNRYIANENGLEDFKDYIKEYSIEDSG